MAKVELDDVDIGILAFLSDVPESTTTQIAKTLYKPPQNIRKLDCFIRYRMKRFIEDGIVKQSKSGRASHYSVDSEKVFFGNGVLKLDGVGEVQMGYFLLIKRGNETIAKSVDDYEKRIGAKTFHGQV